MPETTRESRSTPVKNAGGQAQTFSHPGLTASEAAVECFKEYARERPEIVTLWALGLGFVLGWKLRIW